MFTRVLLIALASWVVCIPGALAEEPAASPQTAPATQPASPREDADEQIRVYQEEYDGQNLEREIEHKQRAEEARKRQELREQRYAEWVDAYLRQQEERQAQQAVDLEERRKQAEERRDELVERHQAMLQRALDRQDRRTEQYQAMLLRAQERQAELAAHRQAMQGMSLEDRRIYIEENLKEILQSPERSQRRFEPRPRWTPRHMPGPYRPSYPQATGEEGSQE